MHSLLTIPASPQALRQAAEALAAGQLVAFPTETVYGLGADAENDDAVQAIYSAKGRPAHNPLIVHVADIAAARRYAQFTPVAEALAKKFWPGPLTLVLSKLPETPLSTHIGQDIATVALRVPAHPVAQSLLQAFGRGIAAPSANRSGRVSPTKAGHVVREFAENPDALAMLLDGGPTEIGIESTVVDCTGAHPTILRPGAVTLEALQEIDRLSSLHEKKNSGARQSPGMLDQHYAPTLPVRMNAATAKPTEALLAFGPVSDAHRAAKATMNLSARGDLAEAAAHLYAHLRALDAPQFSAIAVMPIPEEGIGVAINDRLKRAAFLR